MPKVPQNSRKARTPAAMSELKKFVAGNTPTRVIAFKT